LRSLRVGVLAMLAMGAVAIAPSGASAAQFFSATGALDAGDPTQTDRLFRSGTPDTCAVTDGVSAFGGAGAHHFDLYEFTNITNDPICVTVNLDAMTCIGTQFVFSGAYVPSFDPSAITTAGVGDIGGSPNPTGSYSFTAPPGDFAVNVHEVNAGALCPAYGITLDSDKPFALDAPSIPGTARVGQGLTVDRGDWNGSPTFAEQWRRCDSDGLACADIPGATGGSYVPTAADANSTLRVRISATEAGQTSTIDTEPTLLVSGAQFFSATGALTAGDQTQTGRLFRSGGGDTCATTDGVALFTASDARHFDLYTLNNITNETQCIRAAIDPKTCQGTQFLHSGAYVPSFDPAAIVNNGVADIGASPTVLHSYTFAAPPGAFGVTVYEVTPDALCPEYDIALAALTPFATAAPTVSGINQVNSTLDGTRGSWSGNPAFAQQWRRCNASGGSCADIGGATATSYVPTTADLGSTLRVRIIASDAGLSSSADSAQTGIIGPDTIAPETEITKQPRNNVFLRGSSLRGSSLFLERASKVKAKYKFESNEPGSTFECKFDKKKFKPCDSPKKLKADLGKHKFKVRAIDTAGNKDPSPDKDRFKVKEK
jgi:hypothetical protein